MCGIAGLIYKNGSTSIGDDMSRMLQSMKHRGPDSTGYALYRPPSDDWVMHVKLADVQAIRDFEFEERIRRNRREVRRRLEEAGAQVVQSAMPGRLYKVFNHYKRDEWERYLAAVTDWERDEYLEVLP